MTEYMLTLNLKEVCQQLQLSEHICVELVEYGVVSPAGSHPSEWAFDLNMVCMIQRAMRLHSDLGIDWADIALVADLLEERDRLRLENQGLRRRLARFLED